MSIDKSYQEITLKNWDKIRDRYSSKINDNIVGQELVILQDPTELAWLEDNILEDISNLTGLKHKIKLAVLGGLCSGNTLHEHIDGFFPPKPDSSNWSLNIPIKNYENFKMEWFDGDYTPTIRSESKDDSSPLKADEMQLLRPVWTGNKYIKDSKNIVCPTIVKINIPHTVHNYSNKTRVVLAVRFTPDII